MDLLHERKKIFLAGLVSLKLMPNFNHQIKFEQSFLYYLSQIKVTILTCFLKKYRIY